MPIDVIEVIPKQNYDFSAGNSTQVIDKALDVTAATSGSLLVRVHDVDIASGGSVAVVVKVSAPSDEDPQVDFVGQTVATATVNASSSAPSLIKQDLSGLFGGFLWVEVVGTQGSGTTTATISAALAMKA